MRRGNFAKAWRISDAVLEQRRQTGQTCWDWPRHLQFVWTGGSLRNKRVLVRCYHGLGDTLQFVRFVAPLRAIAREVTLWAQPELIALIATARGVDRVLPLHDGVVEAEFDVDIEIMELPHALRLRPSQGAKVPYLTTKPAPVPQPRGLRRKRVGLVWRSGDWDPRRSLPTRLAAELTKTDGVAFYSLQRGPARRAVRLLDATDVSSAQVTVTASRMLALDLVITVDTMTAHLAGALGVPVWTLLGSDCDWRWMQDRPTSPWYPTMRLFRQHRAGGWEEVIAEVAQRLGQWASAPGS